jgi:hypothetical protein
VAANEKDCNKMNATAKAAVAAACVSAEEFLRQLADAPAPAQQVAAEPDQHRPPSATHDSTKFEEGAAAVRALFGDRAVDRNERRKFADGQAAARALLGNKSARPATATGV